MQEILPPLRIIGHYAVLLLTQLREGDEKRAGNPEELGFDPSGSSFIGQLDYRTKTKFLIRIFGLVRESEGFPY